ncbi:hypothetical protein [uncultured Aquimarina sp.]|uniref:hypothetical protein n=1 Tax=uncultured Aquimarina sp. TaxID=575652 RepID=UPI0026220D1D|nr:hypothetical protein [uncultured Aquimarina sp.]
MKKLLLIFLVIFFWFNVYSQVNEPSVSLKNLAPPNSPAFVLMDVTPSNIIVPENIQSFSIQTLNAFSGNTNNGLSNNNYAIEFQPYWYVTRKNMNFFKYNNLTSSNPSPTNADDYDGYDIFGDLWKRASFSLALLNGDFEVFNQPQSYISVGARTRLISIRTKSQLNSYKTKMKSLYQRHSQFINTQAVQDILAKRSLTNEQRNEQIANLPTYKTIGDNFDDLFKEKPIFVLDMAIAYSYFLGDEEQEFDDTFGRFGIWLSGDFALKTSDISKGSYLHFYGIFRFLKDGINLNEETNELFSEDKTDYGGKIEFEIKRLSFAYEYITRDSENNDESRSIGSIRYKINDAFTLNGGFGENFKSEGNSVVLFGIQWGLDNGSSVKLTQN